MDMTQVVISESPSVYEMIKSHPARCVPFSASSSQSYPEPIVPLSTHLDLQIFPFFCFTSFAYTPINKKKRYLPSANLNHIMINQDELPLTWQKQQTDVSHPTEKKKKNVRAEDSSPCLSRLLHIDDNWARHLVDLQPTDLRPTFLRMVLRPPSLHTDEDSKAPVDTHESYPQSHLRAARMDCPAPEGSSIESIHQTEQNNVSVFVAINQPITIFCSPSLLADLDSSVDQRHLQSIVVQPHDRPRGRCSESPQLKTSRVVLVVHLLNSVGAAR